MSSLDPASPLMPFARAEHLVGPTNTNSEDRVGPFLEYRVDRSIIRAVPGMDDHTVWNWGLSKDGAAGSYNMAVWYNRHEWSKPLAVAFAYVAGPDDTCADAAVTHEFHDWGPPCEDSAEWMELLVRLFAGLGDMRDHPVAITMRSGQQHTGTGTLTSVLQAACTTAYRTYDAIVQGFVGQPQPTAYQEGTFRDMAG